MLKKLTYKLEIKVEGDPEAMAQMIEQYLTNPHAPFRTDYAAPPDGRARPDGYEGPFIKDVHVERVST